MVVVGGDAASGGGAVVVAAARVVPDQIAFMLAHTSGLVSVAMTPERLDVLDLPLMASLGTRGPVLPFTVTVDAREGTTTGISAPDRAATIRALIDPVTRPDDLARPGHVFPVRTEPGGVLRRRRPAEAAVDLVRAAHHYPAAVLCEVVSDDKRRMASGEELMRFVAHYSLPTVGVGAVVGHRHRSECLARRVAQARIPTRHGVFTSYVYEWLLGSEQDLVLVRGRIVGEEGVLVAVHQECLAGDLFRSRGCLCAQTLDASLRHVDEVGSGVLVYLRSTEGRDLDGAPAARRALGDDVCPSAGAADKVHLVRAAHILRDLGTASVVLQGSDGAVAADLEDLGVTVLRSHAGIARSRRSTA
jgi:3,4-dihydroxy 2-butanone 4-phosphate synthase/GTP cyclohydrolase II